MTTRTLLKCLAVPTSVLLVGGFIAFRAGAFERFWRGDVRPTASETSQGDAPLLYSSKSGRIVPGSLKPDVIEPSAGGPKMEPEIQWSYDWPPGAPSAEGPTLMGGSKSATVIATGTSNVVESKRKDK